jgi:hypothetical protein
MKLQTKCTLVIVGLFIIEILPVPITSLYSLYAIRKRPDWLPRVTHELYTDKLENNPAPLITHDPLVIRKNCTVGLAAMFVVDLLVPVVIPTALYVVRRRPVWFKNLITRLYSDKLGHTTNQQHENTFHHDPLILARTEQKLAALEQQNFHFAKLHTRKRQHLPRHSK